MKYAHLIKLTVFSYENEDSEPILNAMLEFFPFHPGKNKIIVNKGSGEGLNKNKINIFEIKLSKTSLINQFLKNLLEKMGNEQKHAIKQDTGSRLDKNLDFFLRFDKDAWVKERRLLLTDSGKCFHLKISIAAFPRKREAALNAAAGLFS